MKVVKDTELVRLLILVLFGVMVAFALSLSLDFNLESLFIGFIILLILSKVYDRLRKII